MNGIGRTYSKCPKIYLPNLSAQAQKFWISMKKASFGVRSPRPLPCRATSCVITFWCLEKMKMFLWSYVNFFCRGRRWGVEANYAYLIPTWSINLASSRPRESKKPTVGQKNIKIMSTPIVHRLFFFVCRFLHGGGCLIILIWSTCH